MPVSSPFRSTQRVYFDDLDALNILHNVRFLLFMERARGELFNALGFRWEDGLNTNPDKYHVVAEHSIRFLRPVRREGDVLVELTPIHLGSSSLIIEAHVRGMHGDAIHAQGTTRLVRLDPETNLPCPWSPRFRAALTPLLEPASAS
jgi:acyl-CoA thioester hydrolase